MQEQIVMKKPERNQFLEVCKLIASFFVVFLHVPFPGTFGSIISCLARFAVPLFFAISGWFSYQTDCPKLVKRFKHILKLELLGILITVGWSFLVHTYMGSDMRQWLLYYIPDGERIKKWLLWNVDPFGGHLWYLSAAALCYAVLWVYTRVQKGRVRYGLLYGVSIFLLAAHFAMDEFSALTGIFVHYTIPRSGIFTGIPMFVMGIFLRQHRDLLTTLLTAKRSAVILTCSIAVSVLEWRCFGGRELYLGSVLTVAAMLLLAVQMPNITDRFWKTGIAKCGMVSTGIYLLHLTVYDFYQTFLSWRFTGRWETIVLFLLPVAVLLVSLAATVLWAMAAERMKKYKNKRSEIC